MGSSTRGRAPVRTVLSARAVRVLAALGLALSVALPTARPALAAGVVIESARALLEGNVRAGAWSAIEVRLANDGPPVSGELRIVSEERGRSTYGTAVDLPTNSRKQYVLYAQPAIFGKSIRIALVAGGATVATKDVPIVSHATEQQIIGVIAERPEGLVPELQRSVTSPSGVPPSVVSLQPDDLPARVEGWTAIDRLVWQDIETGRLSQEQLIAIRTWLGAGGTLVVVAGTTGSSTLAAFEDLLPYRPAATVDVAPRDLASLLGDPPENATSVPALAGIVERGTVLARAGEQAVAAQTQIGTGSVSFVGFDPTQGWIDGSRGATAMWRRFLPSNPSGQPGNPLSFADDSAVVNALGNLPAVQLPPIEQLFALLLGYIVLIGPLNYIVLRRLDRREWAWITMPVLVGGFAVASYSLGASIKGSDVIVNELAIVRAAAGAEHGIGQVYVGVFSPRRRTFEVQVPGGALLSNPVSQVTRNGFEQPLDVVFGDPSRLRGYQVGFGSLRAFRAEATVAVPKVETRLTMSAGRLRGEVTNRSSERLDSPAIVFGGAVAILPALDPGARTRIDVAVGGSVFSTSLSERIFGHPFPTDPTEQRAVFTRRAIVDQLTQYSGKFGGAAPSVAGADTGVLLAWRRAPVLEVTLDEERPQQVGDTIYLWPLAIDVSGPTTFPPELMRRAIVSTDANEAFDQGMSFSLGRGTLIADYRPIGFRGAFRVSTLTMGINQGEPLSLPLGTDELQPLPAAKQPPQDDPLGEPPDPALEMPADLPAVQLFDRVDGRWVEFESLASGRAYRIPDPARYVDESGSVLTRFVARLAQGQSTYFQLQVRLDGEVS